MASLLRGTAFITGAASGIGKATAIAFARYGIQRLAIADTSMPKLIEVKEALHAQFPGVKVLPLDMNVRDRQQVNDGIAEIVKQFGRLDVAVNNAGIGGSGLPTHEVPDEEWEGVLDVDLLGVYRCQKEEIKTMLKQEDLGLREGRGVIVNMSSMYGVVAPNHKISQTAYATAKHGLLGLTKGDGNTYGPHRIRINAICPGYVETPPMVRALETPAAAPLRDDFARTPFGRMAQVEEISDAIAFLASPMASFMQGAALVADGGFTAN